MRYCNAAGRPHRTAIAAPVEIACRAVNRIRPISTDFISPEEQYEKVVYPIDNHPSVLMLSSCGYNDFQTKDEATKAAWGEVVNQYQRAPT